MAAQAETSLRQQQQALQGQLSGVAQAETSLRQQQQAMQGQLSGVAQANQEVETQSKQNAADKASLEQEKNGLLSREQEVRRQMAALQRQAEDQLLREMELDKQRTALQSDNSSRNTVAEQQIKAQQGALVEEQNKTMAAQRGLSKKDDELRLSYQLLDERKEILDEQEKAIEERQESFLRAQDAGSYQTNVSGGGKKRKVQVKSADESQPPVADDGEATSPTPPADGTDASTNQEWMQYVQTLQSQRGMLLNDLEQIDEGEDDDDDDDDENFTV
jgi:chromosome segregation ATPase